ncbi:MAG: hypothetical protein Q9222_004249 [Ikaeria aurantiellina]
MENLSIHDPNAAGAPNHAPPPGGPPQLPPQDLDKDDYIPEPFRKATPEEVHALTKRKNQETKRSDKTRQAKLQALGFEAEHSGEILF